MLDYITTYPENSDFKTPEHVEKKTFYEHRETTYGNHYLAVIDLFVFNDYGELLVQKRSKRKSKSPGLFHTTVGGHVDPNEHPETTLIHECIEEIGVPCILMPQSTTYTTFLARLDAYTDRFVCAKHYGTYKRTFAPYVTADNRTNYIKDYASVYFGIYNGPIQNIDRSADGFEFFSLQEVKEAIRLTPHLFTATFISYIEELENELYSFVDTYCSKKS